MDDETRQLEEELKQLQPSAPSNRLLARVEAGLAPQRVRRPRVSLPWVWAAVLPAAAMVAFGLVRLARPPVNDSLAGVQEKQVSRQPTGTSSEARFKPV